MAENLDKGTFGEQGMGFFLGREGYFFIEGPSGAGGHAANASGFDGVAYNVKLDDLVIGDNKTFTSSANVRGATAIDPAANLAKNLDQLIDRVKNVPDLPAQERILTLLRQTKSSVTGNSVSPPANVRIAVTNFGGNSTGITRGLAARGIRFIDMSGAPRVPVPNSRLYFSKDTVTSMARPVSVNDLNNTLLRANRVGAFASAAAAAAEFASRFSLDRQVQSELGTLTKPIAEALAMGGGALIVVNIIVTAPPGVEGGPKARRVNSSFVIAHANGNREEALRRWANSPKISMSAPHISHEERLFWIPPLQTQ